MQQRSLQPLSIHPGSHPASRAASAILAAYAVAGGLITFTGWALEWRRLTDWIGGGISMFPNTAVCVVLVGIALLFVPGCRHRRWQQLAVWLPGALAVLIGGLTLFQHVAHVNLGIDTILYNRPWGQAASTSPMRMGPPASMSFVALGCGVILATFGAQPRRLASILGLGVIIIASLSLIGYWYNANQLFNIPWYTGIAWQTSTMLACLGAGLAAAIPEHGLISLLRREDAGGAVARRLIVPIIGIPLLLGWLRVMGQNVDLYDMPFGTAVRTVIEILLLVGLLWWTANGISSQAQIARDAARALADANRRKDEFLATLAHELRNPLAAIGSALEIIKIAGDEPELLEQAHETMNRQFAHTVRLVDDLLDIGRITRDKLELRPQPVELATILRQAVEIGQPLADAAGHQLTLEVPPSPIHLLGDPVRLTQVFSNLLNNACKFTAPGGGIRIAATRANHEALVTVTDTGIGIAPDKLELVFEMFSQVDNSLERTQSGLGIGLTLAKRLVEMHGGQLTAASSGTGEGSTFTVRLPVETSMAQDIRHNAAARA